MHGYILTPGFKGRTCQFWVLNRRDLDFCIYSTPLQVTTAGVFMQVKTRDTNTHRCEPKVFTCKWCTNYKQLEVFKSETNSVF